MNMYTVLFLQTLFFFMFKLLVAEAEPGIASSLIQVEVALLETKILQR